jgi:hypothetical protein
MTAIVQIYSIKNCAKNARFWSHFPEEEKLSSSFTFSVFLLVEHKVTF